MVQIEFEITQNGLVLSRLTILKKEMFNALFFFLFLFHLMSVSISVKPK